MNLAWVPLFETGIPVNLSNADEINRELASLRQWMTEQAGYEYEVERLSRLIEGLARALSQEDVEIFVG